MAGNTIKLRGWAAVVPAVLVVAFVFWRTQAARTELEEGELTAVKMHLWGEYASRGVDGLRVALAGGHAAESERAARKLAALEHISIEVTGAKGKPDDTIVRVEIRVDGEEPPDGRPVRYFRLEHSPLTGWRMKGESSALGYWLRLF